MFDLEFLMLKLFSHFGVNIISCGVWSVPVFGLSNYSISRIILSTYISDMFQRNLLSRMYRWCFVFNPNRTNIMEQYHIGSVSALLHILVPILWRSAFLAGKQLNFQIESLFLSQRLLSDVLFNKCRISFMYHL